MLGQSFEYIEELKRDGTFYISKNPEFNKKSEKYPAGQFFKLIQADCHSLPYDDECFDCVVDTFTL